MSKTVDTTTDGATSMGRIILERRPRNHFLNTILVKCDQGYVVWTENTQTDNSTCHGHYFGRDLLAAVKYYKAAN